LPPYCSVRVFIEAINTGRTNVTRALDTLAATRSLAAHADFATLSNEGALSSAPGAGSSALPAWAKSHLPGLSASELRHIDAWPDPQKELVRQALVAGIQGRNVHFTWELHNGDADETQVEGLEGAGDVTVTFRSPRGRVKMSGPPLFRQVTDE
jgi:hypothetical protein